MKKEKDALLAELTSRYPSFREKTDTSSKKRIVRALEVGKYYEENPAAIPPPPIHYPDISPLVLCIRWPREELHGRIDRRLSRRLEQGMVDEVRGLINSGISPERFALFGLEYKYVALYIRDELSYETMVGQLGQAIHRFAKRQMTWFRGMQRRGVEIYWIDRADKTQAQEIIGRFEFV
jgi:tRNA dimethylallyltransferase